MNCFFRNSMHENEELNVNRRQEARGKRQEARGSRQEAIGNRHEASSQQPEAKKNQNEETDLPDINFPGLYIF